MAELFQTTPQNITSHLKEIYSEGELTEKATCKENLQVQTEGGRKVNFEIFEPGRKLLQNAPTQKNQIWV